MSAAVQMKSGLNQSDVTRQFSTFYVADRLYGIDVVQVQEIAKSLPITKINLAPAHVVGLINLRGQIATAIGLRELFGLKPEVVASGNGSNVVSLSEKMSVVCKADGALLSLLVDRIGDVIEVSDGDFEQTPQTIDEGVRRFMKGVYKVPNSILSVIEIQKLTTFLTKQGDK